MMMCHDLPHLQARPNRAAQVTVTLERNGSTVVFRRVPAQVCDTCGEQYVDEQTTSRLLKQANEAASAGVEVEVRQYVA